MRFAVVLSTNPTQFDAVAFRGNFAENVARIADIGYEGVELAIRDPAALDIGNVRRTLARYNLVVPAIGTGQAYGDEGLSFTSADEDVRVKAIARIREHIQLAAAFDALVILGLIRGVSPPEGGSVPTMRQLIAALRECAATAERYGVRLAIEPISRAETDLINTNAEALALLSEVGAGDSTLGLLLDTYHMNIEEPTLEESIRQAGPHIFHFHVADSNRRYPGAGELDFVAILGQLKDEIGYRGWLSAETLPYPDASTAAERGLAHLQACLMTLETDNQQH